MAAYFFKLLLCLLVLLKAQVQGDTNASITFMDSAVEKGAVCLDGSPPAYSYLEGFGDGATSWIVYMQGGGWCYSTSDCRHRSKGMYGSSNPYRNGRLNFSGILDTDQKFNPDFYNWHKVNVIYCDGSSFMSNVTEADLSKNITYRRGAKIFDVVIEEMLSKGMRSAHNAILTGSSAGGLATSLHCDMFRSHFPNTSRVKCISDSGFFIHAKDQPGVSLREQIFAAVVQTHELAGSLPKACTSKMDPSLCLFPEYFVGDIQTPLFIVESVFDSYQIEHNLIPSLGGDWSNCIADIALCNYTQLEIMKDFRTTFIETLENLDQSSSRGMFVHSCYQHMNIWKTDDWMSSNNILSNKTVGEAISDWFFDRSKFQEIDTKNDFPRDCSDSSAFD